MQFQVLLFAQAAELVGVPRATVETGRGPQEAYTDDNTAAIDATVRDTPTEFTVQDVAELLAAQFPQLSRLITVSRWAVNYQFVPPETKLLGSEEIALIPPVSGG